MPDNQLFDNAFKVQWEMFCATLPATSRFAHWGNLNTRFHATIAQLTAMPMLHEMTARVLDQWDRVRRFYLNDVLVFRLAQAQQEHHQIVQAMEGRDDRLAHLVRAHNQGALAAYTEYLADIADDSRIEQAQVPAG